MRFGQAIGRGGRLVAAHLAGRAVPFHVTLYLTKRCNLRCVYCSSPDRPTDELSTEQWCAVLDELHAHGTERVLFFGGEPLVRRDADVLVGKARELGLRTAMATNGTLVPSRPEVVRRLHTLVVSLDGSETSHDRNRGAGSYHDAMAAVEAARAWGVPVKVNAVLNANNAGDLERLLEIGRTQRLPITLNLMRSEQNGLWKNAADHRLEDERIRQLIDRILEARRTNPWIILSSRSYELARRWPDFTRDRLTAVETDGPVPGPPCSAGRFHCAIYPDGRLFPCTLTEEQVPASNVTIVGVAAALARAGRHGCVTCSSVCLLEMNGLFALRPRVIASLARTYLTTGIE